MTVISNLMLVIVVLCVVSLQVASPKPNLRTRKAVDAGKEDCYNITKDKWLYYEYLKLNLVKTEDECKPLCEKNNKCSTFWLQRYDISEDIKFFCVLQQKPIIFVAEDMNVEECKQNCAAMKECKTLMNYRRSCYLYDIEYSNIPADKFKQDTGSIVAQKTC
ncbi:hypothetical protein LOTGIDRAFT_237777 [Lottia gigantea]|uniref:Apple domain-containing protein n=1 Tax=Lottia gigantea TaxID=225164 RepID=V4BB58_LOTGI|nr:hypothetical protein LOTGIDRAFT_237777 [Lottia gigantea]ESP03262.1 hypothetical protein LOTGIDRAFT_237777 [Lottia gigantea]